MEQTLEFASIEEILEFAIGRERRAQEMYLSYAAGTDRKGFRDLLVSMAQMEKGHERKLEELRVGRGAEELFRPLAGSDQKLNETLVAVPFSPDMEYGDFLILVIRREAEAESLYTRLASLARDGRAGDLFRGLAEEERKHKDWAQDRYDRDILTDN